MGHHTEKLERAYQFNHTTSLFRLEKPDVKPALWHIAERTIRNELHWLKRNVPTFRTSLPRNEETIAHCNDCLYRRIALQIVSKKIVATKVYSSIHSMWNKINDKNISYPIKKHGEEWHYVTMKKVATYYYGRADLGIDTGSEIITNFIEIGTVSLFELWYNFSKMKNMRVLLIPTEDYFIEFEVMQS